MRKTKFWISFSPWMFFYIIGFFVNLQMTTEWDFNFLNTAIKLFCFILSLNIPHSTLKIHYFFLLKTQYPFLQNSHFADISPYRSGSDNFEKTIRQRYELHSFAYRFQALIPNSIECFSFINCYGKPIRNGYLGTNKHHWTSIVC